MPPPRRTEDNPWVCLARGAARRPSLPLGSFGAEGSRPNRYSLPLGSFGAGASRGPIVPAYHWVRLAPGLLESQSLQFTSGFVWRGDIGTANRYNLPLGSFGAGPVGRANRNSLPLDVIGNKVFRRFPAVFQRFFERKTLFPITSIGFVWHGDIGAANRYNLPLGSFGAGPVGRANRYSLPLGSFGAGRRGAARRVSFS
jgi:hypothetical protein